MKIRIVFALVAAVLLVALGLLNPSAAAAVGSGMADDSDSLRQIVYVMEIVELRDNESLRVGLANVQAEIGPATGAALQVLGGPDTFEFMRGAAEALRIELGRETTSSQRVSSPWLVTTVGRPAGLRVVQEEKLVLRGARTMYTSEHGIDLRVTPLRFDETTERVLSVVQLKTFGGESQFETELWVGYDEPELVAVLEQQNSFDNAGFLRRESGAQRRYYALSVTARPVGTLYVAPVVPVGSMRGLSNLLWPRTPPARTAFFELAGSVGSPSRYSGAWTGWPGDLWRLHLRFGEASGIGRYEATLQRVIWHDERSDVFLGLHVIGLSEEQGGGTFGVVSVSEELTVLPALKVAAGYAPIVHSFDGVTLGKGMWWAAVEYGRRTVLRIGYNSDVDGNSGVFSVGLRWSFGR